MDGCFAPVSYTTVGDPYTGPPQNKVHESKGKRNFLCSKGKRGQTGATFVSKWDSGRDGSRSFQRLSEGDKYVKPGGNDAKERLKGVQKFLTPNGIRYCSPMKVSTSSGDYEGCFGDPHEHHSDGTYPKRGVRDRIEELLEKRNVMTSPSKRGGYGVVGTLLGGKEIEASSDEYDAARKAQKEEFLKHAAAVGDRKAFKGGAHSLDFFDTMDHVAASKVYSVDDKCQMAPPPAEDSLPPRQRVIAKADGVMKEGYKAFVPNGIMKSGEDGNINKFPEYASSPYDEHAATASTTPQRRLPVARWDMPESLKERKAFAPPRGPRSKLTKGTHLIGINSQTVGRRRD